jgi:curved DNA-binding protein CbpA
MENLTNIYIENYYQILGVSVNAPYESIRKAWLIKIKKCHPDRNITLNDIQLQDISKKAEKINTAWNILKDESKRYKYDLDNRLRRAKCGICGAEGFLSFKNNLVVALCNQCFIK